MVVIIVNEGPNAFKDKDEDEGGKIGMRIGEGEKKKKKRRKKRRGGGGRKRENVSRYEAAKQDEGKKSGSFLKQANVDVSNTSLLILRMENITQS